MNTEAVNPFLAPGTPLDDPLASHLIALLSVYERGPYPDTTVLVPTYEGPSSPQTEHILRSLANISRRMWVAEEKCNLLTSANVHPHAMAPSAPAVSLPMALGSEALSSGESSPLVPTEEFSSSESSPLTVTEELKLLKAHVSDVSRVCNAVARGDFGKKVTVPVLGVVMVQLKDVINRMVDTLGEFATEVKRVSLEAGTEGILGRQAVVTGIEGTWKELIDSANQMSTNLTIQVRSVAGVTTAVAHGDLSKQVEVDARGEVLHFKNEVNGMVLRLRALTAEVARVALEIEEKGKLESPAQVPDVEGSWLELVRNVNRICAKLN